MAARPTKEIELATRLPEKARQLAGAGHRRDVLRLAPPGDELLPLAVKAPLRPPGDLAHPGVLAVRTPRLYGPASSASVRMVASSIVSLDGPLGRATRIAAGAE